MESVQNHYGTTIFGGVLAAIAEGMGGPAPKASPAVSTAESRGPANSAVASRPGLLGRLGKRLWRRQLESVQDQVARSDDLFASLDRWLWKQHARETEAWLAQSQDVYELERRIRHLERNRDGRHF